MIGPHQGNDNLHQAKSGGSQHNHSVENPQQRGDREGSGQTMHTNRSQSRGKSHVSHAENEKDMQREIDELKKKNVVHGEGNHHLDLSLLLRIQRMSRARNDPKLHLVKLSPATRNTVAISVRAKVHRTRALETRP